MIVNLFKRSTLRLKGLTPLDLLPRALVPTKSLATVTTGSIVDTIKDHVLMLISKEWSVERFNSWQRNQTMKLKAGSRIGFVAIGALLPCICPRWMVLVTTKPKIVQIAATDSVIRMEGFLILCHRSQNVLLVMIRIFTSEVHTFVPIVMSGYFDSVDTVDSVVVNKMLTESNSFEKSFLRLRSVPLFSRLFPTPLVSSSACLLFWLFPFAGIGFQSF